MQADSVAGIDVRDFLQELPSLKAKDGKAPWLASVQNRFVLGKSVPTTQKAFHRVITQSTLFWLERSMQARSRTPSLIWRYVRVENGGVPECV